MLNLLPHLAFPDHAATQSNAYSFANSEAAALVAAMNVVPNAARQSLIDAFIGALKAGSVWSKLDVLWVLAAHDEQAGRLNWKSPGNFTLTAVNGPAFAVDQGFTPNGSSSWLDTAWDRATNGIQYTQNDAHISIYQRTAASTANAPNISDLNASLRVSIGGQGNANRGVRVNSSAQVFAPTGGAYPQHILGRRSDGANISVVVDGVQVTAPTAAASVSLGSADVGIGRSGVGYNNGQVAGLSLGANLDDDAALAFYNAWHDFMVGLGSDT